AASSDPPASPAARKHQTSSVKQHVNDEFVRCLQVVVKSNVPWCTRLMDAVFATTCISFQRTDSRMEGPKERWTSTV
ncbi:hypothetical protein BaRGS_00030965, partial [Batillaria attramentaria]